MPLNFSFEQEITKNDVAKQLENFVEVQYSQFKRVSLTHLSFGIRETEM